LLPQSSWSKNDSGGVELSGMGAQEGQLSPYPMPAWEGAGTDHMRRVYRRVPLAVALYRPTSGGRSASPLDFVSEIVEGFKAIYGLLLVRRAELVAPGGLLSRFSQDRVRVVLRPTHAYQLLQEHRLRPDLLRNALELDRHYDKLWVSVKHFPDLARAIAAEQYDLHQDDYPFFTTRPDSTNLWTSTGDQISGFLAEPGLETVKRRLAQLGKRDLKKQIRYIRAAIRKPFTDLGPAR
jgi:lantibiotic modifying enzyme